MKTRSGLPVRLHGVDTTRPRFIHGEIGVGFTPEHPSGWLRAIWHLNGDFVGKREDVLGLESIPTGLPVFVLPVAEKI